MKIWLGDHITGQTTPNGQHLVLRMSRPSIGRTDFVNMTCRIKNKTLGCNRAVLIATPTVAAGYARGLMQLAVSKGASPEVLAARCGIDPEELHDQDNRIPIANFVALMRAGKELCNDPALALHFGEVFDFSEMSIVGLIAHTAETGADAFAQVNRYARLVVEVDLGADNRYELERRCGELWVIDTRENPNDFHELTECSFARIAGMARRLPGHDKFIKAVHFTHAEPAYRAEYDRIFQVPVVFGSDKNAVVTDPGWLTQKPAVPSRYVFGILSAHADALLTRLESSKTVRGCIESALMPLLHTGEANMETVASRLGMSRQTLFRRLKGEGLTFEKVLDELRHNMAIQYLNGKKASVNETAYLVGFSEPAAFSRAFKRWTGLSPREAHFSLFKRDKPNQEK